MAGNGHNRHPKNRRVILLEKLKGGATRRGACGAANISRASFYNWLKDDPGFKANVEACEAQAEEFWVDELANCAKQAKTDPRYNGALIFLMKARFGMRDHGIDPTQPLEDDESNEFTYAVVDGEAEKAMS